MHNHSKMGSVNKGDAFNTSPNFRMQQQDQLSKYDIAGRIGEGTYGVVRKATLKGSGSNQFYAIKEFKASSAKDGEGISLTACREIMVFFHFHLIPKFK